MDLLVQQAAEAGVTHLVCNATAEENWHQVLDYCRSYPSVIPCLGIHPWFVASRSDNWDRALDGLVGSTACGVGEIGLDRNREPFDRAAQEEVFRAQLDMARRHARPATVHCVRSWGWMMDVLRREEPLPAGLLMHAYGGPPELVYELTSMGAYFSFSGKVLEPNYRRARQSLMVVPPDRLLIETDGPCLVPPMQYRMYDLRTPTGEEMSHPANLALVLPGIAELLGEDAETLRARLWENAQRFFGPLLTRNE
jgi:TatD DNase family protein